MPNFSETIRLPLPEEIRNILVSDAKNFELLTPSGKTNKNALYTRVIKNYYKVFNEKLTDAIEKANIPKLKPDEIMELCDKIQSLTLSENTKKLSSISIKPNEYVKDAINNITDNGEYGANRTVYLRNLFASYAMLPAEKREKIVFGEVYSAINDALKDQQNIIVTLNNNKKYPAVSPYKIVSSKEELHLYLLSQGVEDKKIYTTRISKIKNVTAKSNSKIDISEENKIIFDKMIKHGPQFRYEPGENGAIIELNDIGKARYNSIYIHRPEPCDVTDTNRYHFDCSHEQLFRYFSRFDEGFYVVEPESLRNRILEFHKKAIEKSAKLFSL